MSTIIQRKKEIQEKLTLDYLIENTAIFHDPIGGKKLDKYTVDKIQRSYKLWFDSWIKPELKDLLK